MNEDTHRDQRDSHLGHGGRIHRRAPRPAQKDVLVKPIRCGKVEGTEKQEQREASAIRNDGDNNIHNLGRSLGQAEIRVLVLLVEHSLCCRHPTQLGKDGQLLSLDKHHYERGQCRGEDVHEDGEPSGRANRDVPTRTHVLMIAVSHTVRQKSNFTKDWDLGNCAVEIGIDKQHNERRVRKLSPKQLLQQGCVVVCPRGVLFKSHQKAQYQLEDLIHYRHTDGADQHEDSISDLAFKVRLAEKLNLCLVRRSHNAHSLPSELLVAIARVL
mmetsp:Transcript_604/g.1277  ORF Transcript_604/g.1277 Transcript_604/m.1277 type:complete len:270 (+) Transcript_604:643-1452(+)